MTIVKKNESSWKYYNDPGNIHVTAADYDLSIWA
jgi:hypothetical protein